jgi:hypothetical protein
MSNQTQQPESTKPERMCGFRAQFLKPLAKIMAKNDVRYYLNGIHIQSNPAGKGVIISATDGHRLLSILDKRGYTNGEWICEISSSLVSASVKASKHKNTRISSHDAIVTFKGNGTYVYGGFHEPEKSQLGEMQSGLFLSEYLKPIEGNYPKFGRIFKENTEPFDPKILTMNANYLKDCGEVFSMLGNPKFQSISIFGQCGQANVFGLIGHPDDEFDARLLIMPMRNDLELPATTPDWIIGVQKREIETASKEKELAKAKADQKEAA